MKKFLDLLPYDEAIDKFFNVYKPVPLESEKIAVAESIGRVTSTDVYSQQDLPEFHRSSVDGYAVIAKDTYGASDSLPIYLSLVGEIRMGQQALLDIDKGESVLIHTGGMLPRNANAVVMAEYVQQTVTNEIEVYQSVAEGDNVIFKAEDIKTGDIVVLKSTIIRPQEIGGLLALGNTQVEVYKKPKIGIISTGDELVTPDISTEPGQIRDVNSYILSELVTEFGGESKKYGIVKDNQQELDNVLSRAFNECDGVIITAGSSISERDITAKAIGKLGDPGVLVHGVNIKPGKPTILAIADDKPIIGLPGNPVSAFVITTLFVKQIILRMFNIDNVVPKPYLTAELSVNVASFTGRQDWVPVRIKPTDNHVFAEPIFFKSNLIFSLIEADGLICISEKSTGLHAGDHVKVYMI